MLKKLTEKILGEGAENPTVTGWIAGFVVIVLIRSFLETFSRHQYSGIIATDNQRVQYLLFFLTTTLFVTLIVSTFTKQSGNRVINLALYGLPIILLAPIIDLIANAGGASYMDYLFSTHAKLLFNFLTFFGPLHSNGATLGMRIEIFSILCIIGWYVWMKRKSVAVTLGAVSASYLSIFLMGALPGVLYTVSHWAPQWGDTTSTLFNFMKDAVINSNLPTNMLHGTFAYGGETRLLTLGFSAIISQLFYILSFVAGIAWFWYAHKNMMRVIMGNTRTTRVLFYMSLLALGILYAHTKFSVVFVWVDWVGIVVLALSWFSACMYAIHVNDVADVDIDVISNPDRPLPQKTISVGTMRDIGFVWLLLSLVGAYLVGYYAFFMNIVFTSAYYLYSAPPLRLKRTPIFSSFLISLACLATILAGFFFVSPNKMLDAFPMLYAIGIVVVLTLGVNIRDIKDTEGDRVAGIQTIPVIFGAYGKQVVGALLALSFLLVPIFLSFYAMYFIAIPYAIIGYWLCARDQYKEQPIFILFFSFCTLSILLYTSIT